MTEKEFWLEQSKSIYWFQEPKIAYNKKKIIILIGFLMGNLIYFTTALQKI